MEIIIRTDGSETVVTPSAASAQGGLGTPTEPDAAAVPEGLAAKAATRGVNNGGAAPAAPAETGVPPVNVAAAQEQVTPTDGAGESAGAAPAME